MSEVKNYSVDFAGRQLSFEVGRMANQADASVVAKYGDTVILATVVASDEVREGVDFLPLTVDYEERMYAAGKISGSRFIKREGKASDEAILNSRVIDRSIRPLFPKGYYRDVQVIATVLSIDFESDPMIVALAAISAALSISQIPWAGPVIGAKIGLIDDQIIVNPKESAFEKSQLDLIVSSTDNAVVMVEAGARQLAEEKMIEAIKIGFDSVKPVIGAIEKMKKEIGKDKVIAELKEESELLSKIKDIVADQLEPAIMSSKSERNEALDEIKSSLIEKFSDDENKLIEAEINEIFDKLVKKEVRNIVLSKKIRPDSRGFDEIRPITCEVGLIPRVHGSALFTRGQTQALTITTLGPGSAAMMIDSMEADTTKSYMHFYNFPPFSTGEVKGLRSAGRREIGHGALAERALMAVLPEGVKFPYTIRLVSEILSSNGSSSMASVCGSTLSLMDAGVPIIAPVAGIAMGLMTDENGNFEILSDIQGIEDFCGDMDFKVAGTRTGITALQLDVKILGLSFEIIEKTFSKAKIGREFILDKIEATIPQPRMELSKNAPRIVTITINPDKIRDLIGPGGKTIQKIIADFGVEIDVEQDGTVDVFSSNKEAVDKALEQIDLLTAEVEVGKVYNGVVTRILDFGAFVEILPHQEGLVHISQIADQRINKVTDVLTVGDEVKVRVTEIDDMGRVNLSMKATRQDK